MSAAKRNDGGNRNQRRKRRGRGRRPDGGDNAQPKGGGKGANRARGRNTNRRSRGRPPQPDESAFWGEVTALPEARLDVRITEDPSAVARSLGPAPLPGHEQIAQHYFTLVYDRAVTTAGALAAAGGLIDPDTLAEELAD